MALAASRIKIMMSEAPARRSQEKGVGEVENGEQRWLCHSTDLTYGVFIE